MPLNLDSCITGIFVPGNIGASSGLPPIVRVIPSLNVTVFEVATATDTLSAVVSAASAIAEAASAADTSSATVTSASPITWDTTTVTSVTLSGGNLIATNSGTTSTSQGARGANTAGKTSGKHYCEIAFTSVPAAGPNCSVGIGTTASTYANISASATTGVVVFRSSGNIWANGSSTGVTLSARTSTDVIGIAVDLDNLKIWFKKVSGTPGSWNGNASYDPATNVGGVTIPAGTMVPFCTFGGAGGAANNIITGNFGASAFTGAVPSGFVSGWRA